MDKRKYKGITTQKNNGMCIYVVKLRTKTGVAYVGSSRDIDAAAMMYNIYVIEKSITDKIINDVGLTIEQQYRYLDYKGYTFNGEKFNKNKRSNTVINRGYWY